MTVAPRKIRESVLQILYQIEIAHKPNELALAPDNILLSSIIADYFLHFKTQSGAHAKIEIYVRGILKQLTEFDARIVKYSQNWRIERMHAVDINVLRLAIYELENRAELSKKIILNEAVELAKKYGNTQSASFVNGILDAIATDIRG